jgi:hypothetical protein
MKHVPIPNPTRLCIPNSFMCIWNLDGVAEEVDKMPSAHELIAFCCQLPTCSPSQNALPLFANSQSVP